MIHSSSWIPVRLLTSTDVGASTLPVQEAEVPSSDISALTKVFLSTCTLIINMS